MAPPPPPSGHAGKRSRPTSTASAPSEDFERTAEPLASSAFGDNESMIPIHSELTFKDPSKEVVLRIECPDEIEVRVGIVLVRVITAIGFATLIVCFVLKMVQENRWFLVDRAPYIINVCAASMCLLVTLSATLAFSHRLVKARLSGKRWSRRRAFFAASSYSQLIVQTISLFFFLLPNVYILAHECSWFSEVVLWSAVIRWQCWMLTFLNFAVLAHATNPWVNPKAPRADAAIVDAPFFAAHWPKLIIAAVYTCINFTLGGILQHDHHVGILSADGSESSAVHRCAGVKYDCNLGTAALVLSCMAIAILLLFLCLFVFYIWRALHRVAQRNYTKYRLANLSIRLQMRNKGFAVVFFIVSIVLLFYVRLNSCATYVESFIGLLAPQIVLTVTSLGAAFSYMPKDPDLVAPVLEVWLQAFAWSEKGLQRKMEERKRLAVHLPELLNEPMFCFETAIRLFYWSTLVYRYKTENIKDTTYTLETAMKLLELEQFELLWERMEDTKVLMAWSARHIVLSFRGTASLTNVLADLQFWLRAHPPLRGRGNAFIGSRPAVHSGFLRSWLANDLDKRVVQRIREILDEGGGCGNDGAPRCKVYLTGHSLGGALASLAAYDIATAFPQLDVSVYTFGAPRIGNHNFAKDYNKVVPDTWGLINDQDVVTRGGKFGFFKRQGQRVLIDKDGNLLVRPSFVLTSLRQIPWGSSARDHLLASYKESLMAIMLRQFDQTKGFKDGMQGVMELVESIHVMKMENVVTHKTKLEAELAAKLAALASPQAAAAAVQDEMGGLFRCVRQPSEEEDLSAVSGPSSNGSFVDRSSPGREGLLHIIRTSVASVLGSGAHEQDGGGAGEITDGEVPARLSLEQHRPSFTSSAGAPAASLRSMMSIRSEGAHTTATRRSSIGGGGIISSGRYQRTATSRASSAALAEDPHSLAAHPSAPAAALESHCHLPAGMQAGGADVQSGITYQGGVRRQQALGAEPSDAEVEVTKQGRWPGKSPGLTSSADALLQMH